MNIGGKSVYRLEIEVSQLWEDYLLQSLKCNDNKMEDRLINPKHHADSIDSSQSYPIQRMDEMAHILEADSANFPGDSSGSSE